jgi:hypothetical protein
MLKCEQCNKKLLHYQKRFCSNSCQKDHEYDLYIVAWKNGLKNGARGVRAKNFSGHIVRYLLGKYDNACSKCGWDKVNQLTGKCPLEIDHINGNSEDNSEANLQLLCPNCHSLTSTYKNLNFGNGRLWRREKYVKIV